MLEQALKTRRNQINLKNELIELIEKDLPPYTLKSIEKTLIMVKAQISEQDQLISNLYGVLN